jgi:hypothetical protein
MWVTVASDLLGWAIIEIGLPNDRSVGDARRLDSLCQEKNAGEQRKPVGLGNSNPFRPTRPHEKKPVCGFSLLTIFFVSL